MFKYFLIFMISLNCYASDKWSDADKIRETIFLTVDTMDWLQTRNIARNPDKYYEKTSFIYGSHPSVGKVNNLFLAGALLHVGFANTLCSKPRENFQYITIFLELLTVIENRKLGISMAF